MGTAILFSYSGGNATHLSQTPAVSEKVEKQVMRVKVAKVLLFAYLVMILFKPVMPLVADMLAHTFWNETHMMQVHEVNGKFHIHSELASAGDYSTKEKPSQILKFEIEEYVHEIANELTLYYNVFAVSEHFFIESIYTFSCHFSDYHPPRFF